MSSAAATSGRRARSARPAPTNHPAASRSSQPALCARRHDGGPDRPAPQACRPIPSSLGRSCWPRYRSPAKPQRYRHIRQNAPRPRQRTDVPARQDAAIGQHSGHGWRWHQSFHHATKAFRDQGIPHPPIDATRFSYSLTDPKGDIWSDFWNWLTGWVQDAVNYITDVVVAVAEDIVVGIRMIINGVAQVFNAIIRAVEDIAAAIG